MYKFYSLLVGLLLASNIVMASDWLRVEVESTAIQGTTIGDKGGVCVDELYVPKHLYGKIRYPHGSTQVSLVVASPRQGVTSVTGYSLNGSLPLNPVRENVNIPRGQSSLNLVFTSAGNGYMLLTTCNGAIRVPYTITAESRIDNALTLQGGDSGYTVRYSARDRSTPWSGFLEYAEPDDGNSRARVGVTYRW